MVHPGLQKLYILKHVPSNILGTTITFHDIHRSDFHKSEEITLFLLLIFVYF